MKTVGPRKFVRRAALGAAIMAMCSVTAYGDPDEPIPCTLLFLRPGAPGLVKLVCKSPAGGSFELPSELPTTLTILIKDTADGSLGASSFDPWKALGNPPGSKGFRLTPAPLSPASPCKTALIQTHVVKVLCSWDIVSSFFPLEGDAIAYVQVTFLSAESKLYCSRFGGIPVRNDTTGVLRRNAPAPPACF
jgi:hypothetical protein